MVASRTSRKPTPPPLELPPIGISYIRFSTPEQAEGDSYRRQTEETLRWCKAHQVELDNQLNLSDLGTSAFKPRKRTDDGMASMPELDELVNGDRRALAGFLECIRQRKIPRGAYLVIENLDRLSRDEVVPATHLLLSILVAGVRVVQLQPRELVLTDKADMADVMMAVIELSRGHGESERKSGLLSAA
jgi:DNA invertase Pin-like site-specific DNA recombinase